MADEVAPYEEWTKAELEDELRNRQLATSGNKDELVARLESDDAGTGTAADTSTASTAGASVETRKKQDSLIPGQGTTDPADVKSSIGPDGYQEPEAEELEPVVIAPVASSPELDAFLADNPYAERIPPTLLPWPYNDPTIATPGMPELIDAPNQPVTEPADAATWRERDMAVTPSQTMNERDATERNQREARVRSSANS